MLESAHESEVSVRIARWVYRRKIASDPWATYARISPFQFYDLAADPGESHNTFGELSPDGKVALERLERLSREFLAEKGKSDSQTLEQRGHIEALKALGYVQ